MPGGSPALGVLTFPEKQNLTSYWLAALQPEFCTIQSPTLSMPHGRVQSSLRVGKEQCFPRSEYRCKTSVMNLVARNLDSCMDFTFFFKRAGKQSFESPAAGDADKAECNFTEGCPFFCYLSEVCFCWKFKHATL